MNKSTYLDLTTIPRNILGKENDSFIWPTPYTEYLNASSQITRMFVDEIYYNNDLSDVFRAGAISITSTLISDFTRIIKASLDIQFSSNANTNIIVNKIDYPVASFLLEGSSKYNYLKDIEEKYLNPIKSSTSCNSVIDNLRHLKSKIDMSIFNTSGRIDIQSVCPLLSQHISMHEKRTVNIRAERWSRESHNRPGDELEELISNLIARLASILSSLHINNDVVERATLIGKKILFERLLHSWKKADYINNLSIESVAGDVLVGGTPQPLGMLLNWKYLNMGRNVWRFTHGGDRTFFDDINWGISEFPFCSEYYVHGIGEKKAIEARIKRAGTHVLPDITPDIIAIGSSKHNHIWEQSHEKTNCKNNKVMFVTGSFLGEKHMGTLDFKTPDPLIADTQAWVVRKLNEMGYKVSIKTHPKGLYHDLNIQKGWGASVYSNKFDLDKIDASVLLFDFGGSAFFDALASNKGIVLLDLKNRPFSKETYDDLNKRCQIISATIDPHNRLRFDPAELKEAIEDALECNGCPEWFAEKYFGLDL